MSYPAKKTREESQIERQACNARLGVFIIIEGSGVEGRRQRRYLGGSSKVQMRPAAVTFPRTFPSVED